MDLASEKLSWSVGSAIVVLPNLSEYQKACEGATQRASSTEAYASAHRDGAALGFDAAVAYALGEQLHPPESIPCGPAAHLTKRELEVADLIAEGLTNKEIAARWVISPRTAQGHVEHLLTKLGLTSRAQVAAWVVETRRENSVAHVAALVAVMMVAASCSTTPQYTDANIETLPSNAVGTVSLGDRAVETFRGRTLVFVFDESGNVFCRWKTDALATTRWCLTPQRSHRLLPCSDHTHRHRRIDTPLTEHTPCIDLKQPEQRLGWSGRCETALNRCGNGPKTACR